MPGRKSSSGSEGKPPGSKPDPKASSSKPYPKSGSQPKDSLDKKGKGPMPKSTQDEPSKESRTSRDGESSTHTQPPASEGNTTQAETSGPVQLNSWSKSPGGDHWTQYSPPSGRSPEEGPATESDPDRRKNWTRQTLWKEESQRSLRNLEQTRIEDLHSDHRPGEKSC